MKKFFNFFAIAFLLTACGELDTTAEKTKKEASSLDTETVFSFDVNNLEEDCNNISELVCCINTTVKCILNPTLNLCEKNKEKMPSFVFMQDESLSRPTFQSYKITKIVPREDGAVEVFTQSSCNGNWFGLCNGNIVYVMKNINSTWRIVDLYALEF